MDTYAPAQPNPELSATSLVDIALDICRGQASIFDLILGLCRLFGLTLLVDLAYCLWSLFAPTARPNALNWQHNHDEDNTKTEIMDTPTPTETNSDSESRFGPPFNLGRNPHTEIKNGINLDQSIKDHQEALRLQPEGHPSRAQTLSSLTVDLSMRFEQTGDRSDLDQSIKYGYEARTLWPDGNPGKAPLLANLSASLGKRYEQTHDIDDIEQRMMLLEQMRNLESDERQDSPTSYFDLPTQSGDQQQNMGAPAFEEDDPELRAGSLSDLSLRLWVQFEETGNRSDLDQSIEHGEEALKLWPEEHPFKAMSLSNLAVGLSKRFEQTKNNDDLDRSIEYGEEAVKLWPEAGESRVTPLSNLALGLTTRFKRTRKLIDLARSVEHLQEVAVLLPEDDPSRSETMCKMATAMRMMMEEVGNFRNRGRGAGF